mmetsp:Transcript_15056/g.46849  ORF Transcript_15056/g.46849 Transcript_15056/m.46849 type:complete len:382 (+) Transcript_15056:505-1650(+)
MPWWPRSAIVSWKRWLTCRAVSFCATLKRLLRAFIASLILPNGSSTSSSVLSERCVRLRCLLVCLRSSSYDPPPSCASARFFLFSSRSMSVSSATCVFLGMTSGLANLAATRASSLSASACLSSATFSAACAFLRAPASCFCASAILPSARCTFCRSRSMPPYASSCSALACSRFAFIWPSALLRSSATAIVAAALASASASSPWKRCRLACSRSSSACSASMVACCESGLLSLAFASAPSSLASASVTASAAFLRSNLAARTCCCMPPYSLLDDSAAAQACASLALAASSAARVSAMSAPWSAPILACSRPPKGRMTSDAPFISMRVPLPQTTVLTLRRRRPKATSLASAFSSGMRTTCSIFSTSTSTLITTACSPFSTL